MKPGFRDNLALLRAKPSCPRPPPFALAEKDQMPASAPLIDAWLVANLAL
jgi:hypothetical protein